jgi:hypothetical protein
MPTLSGRMAIINGKRLSDRECCDRWLNCFDPTIKLTEWTSEEDDTLIELAGSIRGRSMFSEISRVS